MPLTSIRDITSNSTTGGNLYTASGTAWTGWCDTSTAASTINTTWDHWSTTTATNGIATLTSVADTVGITDTSSTSSTSTFFHWVNAATGSASTVNNVTWGNWVNQVGIRQDGRVRVEVSEEVRREAALARTERDRQWRAEREEREAKRKLADETAMQLLRSCLSQEQNDDLRTHGHFFVKGQSGRLYRIDKGKHGNIKAVDPQTKVWYESLCAAPRGGVPNGDAMLMQKLMLETAEEAFRSYSNISLKDGKYVRGKTGPLTGEELGKVLMFPKQEQAAA